MKTKRKYLDKIGVVNRPDLWNLNDKRQKQWKKDRKKYGFDERETWSLDYSWHLWLYERLVWYKKYAPVDLTYHKFIYKDNEYTQEEMINMILERLELSFLDTYNNLDEKQYNYVKEIEYIWAELCSAMWW